MQKATLCTSTAVLAAAMFAASAIMPARASSIDDEHYRLAVESISKGIEYLREQQNEDGSWSPEVGPAITALAVTVMLDQPNIGKDDPAVQKGIEYILSTVRDDGGIYSERTLPVYNTAISLSALSRVRGDPRVAEAIQKGEKYLRSLQYTGDREDPHGDRITEDHPYRGGFGYGRHGRPDGSNTQIAAQAFRDLGVDCEDPAFVELVRYTSRLQGIPENEMFGDQIVNDGGAIYATSLDSDHIGVPESRASPEAREIIEDGGEYTQPLQTYGSMTYAMFKTYIYAELDRDDVRVRSAYEWVRRNFTVEHNPGNPEDIKYNGYYYYLMTMGRALAAWGMEVRDTDGEVIHWRRELTRELVERQEEDGSWVNMADRYMEGNPELVTCYALIALNNAIGREP